MTEEVQTTMTPPTTEDPTVTAPPKRKRGRPRKNPETVPSTERPVGRRVEDRKPAPNVTVIEDQYTDPRKQMVAHARAAMGDDARGLHFHFVSGKRWKEFPEQYLDQGYRLAQGPNGRTWNHRGDPLLVCPESDYQRRIREPAVEAADQLRDTMRGDADGLGAVDQFGDRHGLVNENDEEAG